MNGETDGRDISLTKTMELVRTGIREVLRLPNVPTKWRNWADGWLAGTADSGAAMEAAMHDNTMLAIEDCAIMASDVNLSPPRPRQPWNAMRTLCGAIKWAAEAEAPGIELAQRRKLLAKQYAEKALEYLAVFNGTHSDPCKPMEDPNAKA